MTGVQTCALPILAFNGNYTGRMYVPHLMSEVNGTADVLVKSPDFFELGVKLSYDFRLTAAMTLQLNLGIQNLFDSYQNDFDKGATRESGYIYGPGTPRTDVYKRQNRCYKKRP